MLSIGIGSAAEYYLSRQQSYYIDTGEPPGRWFAPDAGLGLRDGKTVDPAVFRALHAGYDPAGRPLVQNAGDRGVARVGGIDATFSAPKGVSLLWAGAEPGVRQAIEEAHDRAVRGALQLLQRHAAFTRRGHGGVVLEPTRIFAALFQHGEARPETHADGSVFADPDLHTHADIVNIAPRADGTWGALDARALLDWKLAGGAVYRAELSARLRELGFETELAGDKGLFDVAGVPDPLKEFFSARRTAIEAALAADGLISAEAAGQAARAALATRQSKAPAPLRDDRHTLWRAKAAQRGHELDQLARELGGRAPARRRAPARPFRATAATLEALTQREAVFGLADLYAHLAQQAIAQSRDLGAINSAVEALRRDGRIIALETDEGGMLRFTTAEMLRVERNVRDRAARLERRPFAAVDQGIAEAAARGAGLSEEQVAAVAAATDGRSLAVVEGAAGAGKSTSLVVVARVYQTQGRRVIGAATAWRIANQLGADCGIEAKATADWLTRAAAGERFLDRRTVLIVDEAGQLSARDMRAILSEVDRARAKVILTGDSRQLQPIDAGPGLRLVLAAAPGVRVDQIRRQREPWMRDVVRDLMTGRADRALDLLDTHGRITWFEGRAAAVDALVSRWAADRARHPDSNDILIARTHAEVRAINERVRDHLRKTGELGPDLVALNCVDGAGRTARLALARGDCIRVQKKLKRYGLINGSEVEVESVRRGRDGGVILNALTGGRRVEINLDRIADGRGRVPLGHGYAATLYSAQGVTRDRAYVLGSANFGREEAYVALSRARQRTDLFIDGADLDRRDKKRLNDPGRRLSPSERRERLAARWAQERGKTSALALTPEQESSPEIGAAPEPIG